MRLRLTHSSSICGLALSCLLGAAGCGGNSGMQQPVFYPITIALSSATATIFANGVPPALTVTVIREPADTNPVTLAVSGCPSGVLPQITSPGTGSTGSIVFNAVAAPLPGNYPVTVLATEGEQTVSASLALAVQSAPVTVNVAVSPTVNTILGFGGLMETMMNTQFQAAEWAQSFFPSVPSATTTLANLHPQHIRVYTNSLGIPQRADKSWDFTVLDATLDPVIGVGDKSINLVLVQGPPWMCTDVGPNCVLQPQNYQDFANYAAQMVKYYNTTTGFTDNSGVQHVHTPFTPITYWSIYSQIGLVTLIGLISKHGILMVDFANRLQETRGFSRRGAIEEAAAVRLRPILMTTAAMVVGMIPLILASGSGASSRFDIGLTIFSGMAIGTLFTLFVAPRSIPCSPATTRRRWPGTGRRDTSRRRAQPRRSEGARRNPRSRVIARSEATWRSRATSGAL